VGHTKTLPGGSVEWTTIGNGNAGGNDDCATRFVREGFAAASEDAVHRVEKRKFGGYSA